MPIAHCCHSVITAAELLEQHRQTYTMGQTLSSFMTNHELKGLTGRFQEISAVAHRYHLDENLFLSHVSILAAAVSPPLHQFWWSLVSLQKSGLVHELKRKIKLRCAWSVFFWVSELDWLVDSLLKSRAMEEKWGKTRTGNTQKVWKGVGEVYGWEILPSVVLGCLNQLSCLIVWLRYTSLCIR